jgi:type I restriction enzyme, S subunit
MPQHTHNNTPNLRFPEFHGEWEVKKLGEVVSFKITNSFSRENLNYEGGLVKNIHYGDIHTKFRTLFDIKQEIVPYVNSELRLEKIAEENYCQEGDIVFADASEDLNDVGKSIEIVNLNSESVLAGLHTLLARPEKNQFFIGFAGHLFKSTSVRLQIQKEAQGTKVLSISAGRLSGISISFPSLAEQTKIAQFLTAIDERLQALKHKKQLLEQWKKGLMQQIFSQQLRFKDENGADFGEWEVRKLGEVTYKVDKKNKNKELLPVYSINNKEGFVPQSEQFEGVDSNERGYDTSLYKVIEDNTFAYNPARINVGSIGYSGKIGRVIVSSLYVCFKTHDNIYDLFFSYYLQTPFFNKEVLKNAEGGVRDYLFYENFSIIPIFLPCLAEQTKIAQFLSSVDDRIERVSVQVSAMERYKKGLLQRMFV